MVQIAEDRGTRIEYAMKFFLSRAAFEHELALYADNTKPLGAFLPEVHSIIDPSKTTFLDAAGVPLPPCIIMEKGESLDKWAASCTDGLDMVTGLQVCCFAVIAVPYPRNDLYSADRQYGLSREFRIFNTQVLSTRSFGSSPTVTPERFSLYVKITIFSGYNFDMSDIEKVRVLGKHRWHAVHRTFWCLYFPLVSSGPAESL